MRVALFTDTYLPDVNGVAKTLGRWAGFLRKKGIECKVFAPTGEERAAVREPNSVERFFSLPFFLYPECKFAVPNPIHINKTLHDFKPDIIHVATPFNLGLYGSHYARKHGIPLVASYHTHFDQYAEFYKLQWMVPLFWKYMLWFHADCRKVYVPSPSALEHLKERGLKNLEVWSRGIQTELFRDDICREAALREFGIDPRKFVVLYVGRLAPEKSIDVLLQAFEAVPEPVRSRMELVMAGDGPLRQELAEAQSRRGLPLRLLGYLHGERLSRLYAGSDVFLFPSVTETFGNVVLEAMACGTPVIGAAAGGVKDNVRHGATGLLCPPGDAAAFAQALLTLYDSPGLLKRLGAGGRHYALTQSWDSVFERLLSSYRGLLEKEQTAGVV
ncbi:glycosyltransferase family 4 protein [Paenibacillus thermotolerans]|uniref:glycosyltransferase family 4 protein n=1 Tax=Paenibacillus thermotolerans TaxID=3027807 RepID=UPI002367F546|nr:MULTISPECIES: glycosyltransferase family 1 protein [unclassified Paenibacillus]